MRLAEQPAPERGDFTGQEEDGRGDQCTAQAPVAGGFIVAPPGDEIQQQESRDQGQGDGFNQVDHGVYPPC